LTALAFHHLLASEDPLFGKELKDGGYLVHIGIDHT